MNVVIISAFQDYRSKKRASIHQIADGFVKLGYNTSFVSTRFSNLSKYTNDSRLFLLENANSIEVVNGVNCYLWKTFVHPFASSNKYFNQFMVIGYKFYGLLKNKILSNFLENADYVIIESGIAAIHLAMVRKLAPNSRVIYYAADKLDTVGAHPYIQKRLQDDSDKVDHFCLRSRLLKDDFSWAADRLFLAEFGIDRQQFLEIGSNPYQTGTRNIVSVGSMLFDENYFTKVATAFPDVKFHVIGCGKNFSAPENVIIYDEMPFNNTLPYVKFASAGLAPYLPIKGANYLAESSLKLAQYEYLKIPSICPDFAVGDNVTRHGYDPTDADSMIGATQRALDAKAITTTRNFLSWEEVATRVLHPENFPETRLQ